MGTLRELIVLMRIWGLIRPACLPSFRKTTENLDVLPLLFRLLTKLSVTPHDPDESLIGKGLLHFLSSHFNSTFELQIKILLGWRKIWENGDQVAGLGKFQMELRLPLVNRNEGEILIVSYSSNQL